MYFHHYTEHDYRIHSNRLSCLNRRSLLYPKCMDSASDFKPIIMTNFMSCSCSVRYYLDEYGMMYGGRWPSEWQRVNNSWLTYRHQVLLELLDLAWPAGLDEIVVYSGDRDQTDRPYGRHLWMLQCIQCIQRKLIDRWRERRCSVGSGPFGPVHNHPGDC